MRPPRITVAALVTLLACDDSTGPRLEPLAFGAIVMNGFGQPGITVVPEDNSPSTHIDFGSAFDAATFTLFEDTVLATSSKASGDLLYLAELTNASLRTVQLPPASNPGNVAVVPADITGADSGRFMVALRDSGAIAQVRLTGDAVVIRMLRGAGLCPSDVVIHDGAAWAVDANQRCFSDYVSEGPGRMIRVPLLEPDRDTIVLEGAAAGAQRAFLIGDHAYVYAGGDFSSKPASVSKVDLASRRVTATLQFPTAVYGATMRLGADGLLYVTAAPITDLQALRVFAVDPETMSFSGPFLEGAQHRSLVKPDGTQASCFAATANREGRVYCIENGEVVATLLVFNPDGSFLRSAPAGTLAFDITLR